MKPIATLLVALSIALPAVPVLAAPGPGPGPGPQQAAPHGGPGNGAGYRPQDMSPSRPALLQNSARVRNSPFPQRV